MLSFSAGEWEGLNTLGVDALRELKPAAEAAIVQGAQLFVSELQKTLTGQRTGRMYEVSRTGQLHQASAPGEPPAVLYGQLRRSITWTGPRWTGWMVEVEVGTNVKYARRLEFGGVHVTTQTVRVKIHGEWRTVKAGTVIRILPRPWVAPTALRVEPMLERLFEALV